jgi:hypothetical protein
MGIDPIGGLCRRYQPKVNLPKHHSSCLTVNGLCQIVEISARTTRLDTNLMGLRSRAFEYNHLVTLAIYVLVSTVCSLRGSQSVDQKLVKSFGLLGLRIPPLGLNLQCRERSQPMATSHVW